MTFKEVYAINVNEFVEKKAGLSYLSWATAWRSFMEVYPMATYTIEKDAQGRCWFGDDKSGYMVYTTVTVEGVTHEMWLPVMDNRNKSILVPTSFEINKTIMRCLTKNLAMFGLGLYIYQGEDLPTEEQEPTATKDQIKLLFDIALKDGYDQGMVQAGSKKYFSKYVEKLTSEEIESLKLKMQKKGA